MSAPGELQERPVVLVVDDEAEILVALTDLFEDAYEVLAAQSPAEALDLLQRRRDIAVIVSDQRMPDMPGNVFLARARAFSDADGILLTGYADISAVAAAVNEGRISGYVTKPWEPEALRSMIDSAAERARLRAALAFEQRVYAALVDDSAYAVSVLDHALQLKRRNPRKSSLDRESQARRPADAHADAADRAALARGRYSVEEHQWTDETGRERWLRTRRIPFGDDPAARHLLKIESDETERRQAQQKLHQAEKLQALGTLAGGIAHDFNNLLAIVVGNLELAQRAADKPEKLARYLASAMEAAGKGGAISRRLLSFSRQRDLAMESFRPEKVIADLHPLLQQSMAGRATVRLDLTEGLWPVRADRSQFELALVNLCINARDAMPDGGEVVIRASNVRTGAAGEAKDHVCIDVIDTGTGISPEVQERVFEPFFTTKPQGVGTGLGLPIVRSMAQAAGGDVLIESELGKGTTLRLCMPRHDIEPDGAETQAAAGSRPLDILLVEDNAALRGTLEAQLRELGHSVESCGTARTAIAAIEKRPSLDLVITDYAMPRMTGTQLIAKVRKHRPDLPCLLVTGYAESVTAQEVPVLTKPFTLERLAVAIANARNSWATAAG